MKHETNDINGDCFDVKFQPINWQKKIELDKLKFEKKIFYNSNL
jgi:hypothetical protein